MAIQSWTLCSLVGAYLDLALAFLFLSACALTFLASKFLALLGLALPCPCNGLFGQPRSLQGLLADYPANKIAAVHMSLRNRFPFACPHTSRHYDVSFFTDGGGEGSSGSASNDARNSKKKASLDVNSEEVLFGERPPSVPRRRRRRRPPFSRRGRSPRASPTPPLRLGWQGEVTPRSSFSSGGRLQRGVSEESGESLYLFGECLGLEKGVASATECSFMEKDASAGAKEVSGSEGNVTTVMRNLQRALTKEQSAHAALSLELKEERSAAATAADEAMAMILRLQKEKAEIELEARQYRSIVEEKTAYDEEEVDILKEIIVRRERENHVLKKELNAYRQMMLDGGEHQSDTDLHDMTQLMARKPGSSSDPFDDPMLELQQFYGTLEEKEEANSLFQQVEDTRPLVGERPNCTAVLGSEWLAKNNGGYSNQGNVEQDDGMKRHHEEMRASGAGRSIEFQEKGMVTMHQVTSLLADEGGARRLPSGQLEMENDQLEVCVHDVHVIDDETHMADKRNVKDDNKKNGLYGDKFADRSTSNKATGGSAGKINIRRSCSDVTKMEQFTGGLREKASCFLRRHSMPVVDRERFILESEVEFLRNRLKIIQQGREQLSFSMEGKKESDQSPRLEERSRQLQEHRQVTKPDKRFRQAPLPPKSSKVRH